MNKIEAIHLFYLSLTFLLLNRVVHYFVKDVFWKDALKTLTYFLLMCYTISFVLIKILEN